MPAQPHPAFAPCAACVRPRRTGSTRVYLVGVRPEPRAKGHRSSGSAPYAVRGSDNMSRTEGAQFMQPVSRR